MPTPAAKPQSNGVTLIPCDSIPAIIGIIAAVKGILSTPLNLSDLREKWHDYKSINMNTSVKVLVSHHPSTLLKSPKLKKEAWGDLQMLQKKLNEN